MHADGVAAASASAIGSRRFARLGVPAHLIVGAGLAAAMIALIIVAFASSSFYVWGADVTGTRWLSSDGLYAMTGIEGTSIFYVDSAQVQGTLQSLPAVERVSVVCGLPNWVAIDVVERTPAAIWQSQGNQYWVDRKGMLFDRAGDLESPTVVVELDAVTRQAGETVDVSALSTALELRGLLPKIRTFAYSAADGVSFDLPDGRRVMAKAGGDAAWMVDALNTVVEYLEQQKIQARIIDLRYDKRAFWR